MNTDTVSMEINLVLQRTVTREAISQLTNGTNVKRASNRNKISIGINFKHYRSKAWDLFTFFCCC